MHRWYGTGGRRVILFSNIFSHRRYAAEYKPSGSQMRKCMCRQLTVRLLNEMLLHGGKMKILVINGPNLNFLGIREKNVYGSNDYETLVKKIENKAAEAGADIEVWQSNHEGAIIDKIQKAYYDHTDAIIINPGAYTHYSYAIHDALKSVENIHKVEIHISDIMSREEFRKVSVTAPACDRQIYGHGLDGYLEAIDWVLQNS